jgi:flagellar basal-body rod modification protein FlgD
MVAAATASSSSSNASSALFESLNGKKETKSSDSLDFAQNRFLTLLTTQLKNQDPLNPMDNAQMTSQLAQISTVDGIERLNSTLSKLIDGQSENQTLQAAALVGRGVMVAGSDLNVANSYGLAGYELAEPADRVAVEIKDANGLVVRTLRFEGQEAGVQMFTWDGKTDNNTQAADDAYTISVSATRGTDKVTAERLTLGFVDSVARTGKGLDINLGKLGKFGMADIKQIL